MKYILASASPRRKELLSRAGFPFEVIPSEVEEILTGNSPEEIVTHLAAQKAKDVFDRLPSEDLLVIGADTIVVYRDEILGKPAGSSEAFDMLSMLSDQTHQVYTGVALFWRREGALSHKSFAECTDVTFYPVSKEDLNDYVASGDPLDKAGAYGIQGTFAKHVKEIRGDYNNVVGLPLGRLYQELIQEGLVSSFPRKESTYAFQQEK